METYIPLSLTLCCIHISFFLSLYVEYIYPSFCHSISDTLLLLDLSLYVGYIYPFFSHSMLETYILLSLTQCWIHISFFLSLYVGYIYPSLYMMDYIPLSLTLCWIHISFFLSLHVGYIYPSFSHSMLCLPILFSLGTCILRIHSHTAFRHPCMVRISVGRPALLIFR